MPRSKRRRATRARRLPHWPRPLCWPRPRTSLVPSRSCRRSHLRRPIHAGEPAGVLRATVPSAALATATAGPCLGHAAWAMACTPHQPACRQESQVCCCSLYAWGACCLLLLLLQRRGPIRVRREPSHLAGRPVGRAKLRLRVCCGEGREGGGRRQPRRPASSL